MARFIDARVPVRIAAPETATPQSALLIQGDRAALEGPATARFILPNSAHAIGCACCLPRGPVAEALSRLFQARARGDVGFFREVVAVPADADGAAAVRAALADDPFVAARFRAA